MSRLPQRMFQSGHEPSKRRVHSYSNLRWIEYIKPALEAEHLSMLEESQFGRLMQMGNHSFPVNLVHYLLSRQLVTEKKFELWWVFAGKPIRCGIQEFALVTGLDCGTVEANERKQKRKKKSKVRGREREIDAQAGGKMWKSLFEGVRKPTPAWILDRLKCGKNYKDPVTRLRLALIFLVEGMLCPRSGTTNLRPFVVEMVEDIEEFLRYPWGRDSFLLMLKNVRTKTPASYIKDSTAVQGFPHAIVLIAVCCCPAILETSLRGGDPRLAEDNCVEDIVQAVVERYHSVSFSLVSAMTLDLEEEVTVRSLLCREESGQVLGFLDEEEDEEVNYMLQLISEGFHFEHKTWCGGVSGDGDSQADDGDESTQAPHEDVDPLHEFIKKMFEEHSLSLKAHIDQGLANLRSELMMEIEKIRNNISVPKEDEDIPIGTNVSSSSEQEVDKDDEDIPIGTNMVLISALKGSRTVHGLRLRKTRVSWAADVYDPPPSSKEWLAAQVQEPASSSVQEPTSSSGASTQRRKRNRVQEPTSSSGESTQKRKSNRVQEPTSSSGESTQRRKSNRLKRK